VWGEPTGFILRGLILGYAVLKVCLKYTECTFDRACDMNTQNDSVTECTFDRACSVHLAEHVI
jgi:hypothetical protein